MNHPRRMARKKLLAEIKRLNGQLIAAQMMTAMVCQVSAVQVAVLQASIISRNSMGSGGVVVEVNTSDTDTV